MSPRTLKRLSAALGVIAAILILAACGGTSRAPTNQEGTTSGNYTEAVVYARCMRAHGVGNFPDPTSNGGFIIGGTGSANPAHSPEFDFGEQCLSTPARERRPARSGATAAG